MNHWILYIISFLHHKTLWKEIKQNTKEEGAMVVVINWKNGRPWLWINWKQATPAFLGNCVLQTNSSAINSGEITNLKRSPYRATSYQYLDPIHCRMYSLVSRRKERKCDDEGCRELIHMMLKKLTNWWLGTRYKYVYQISTLWYNISFYEKQRLEKNTPVPLASITGDGMQAGDRITILLHKYPPIKRTRQPCADTHKRCSDLLWFGRCADATKQNKESLMFIIQASSLIRELMTA